MVNGEIFTDKVYEDGDTLAFLDLNPSAPGHTLVIPKQHRESILELSEYELNCIFRTVQKVTGMIKDTLRPEGFNLGINQGHIAGQRVPHLQVHIIPRFNEDGGGTVQMVVSNKPKEDNSAIAKKIRHGEELPAYIEEQVKPYRPEPQKKPEEPKKEKSAEEKELERREKELFPQPEKAEEPSERDEEEGEEDVYEKMLKRLRIPN